MLHTWLMQNLDPKCLQCAQILISFSMQAGSYFVLSMLDRLWHPDLTQDEAVELMEKGIEEVSPAQAAYAHHVLVGIYCWTPLHVQLSTCISAHCMSGCLTVRLK